MITRLSKNNIAFFDELIPNDEMDNLIIEELQYFGRYWSRMKRSRQRTGWEQRR